MTGYLTCKDGYKGDSFNLVIPNLEILSVFRKSFIEQFKRANTKYTTSVFEFYNALQNGDAASVKEFFESYLKTYASVRNANARRGKKKISIKVFSLVCLCLKEIGEPKLSLNMEMAMQI